MSTEPPPSPWGKLLDASVADAQPPADQKARIMAAVAKIEAEEQLRRMPPPANDRWFKPWMGMAAAIAVVAVVGVASLAPNPQGTDAPVIAADAGLPADATAPLLLPIGPDGLTAADTAQLATWLGQTQLCGGRIRLTVPPDASGDAAAAAVARVIAAKAGCPLPVDRTAGVKGLLELNAG